MTPHRATTIPPDYRRECSVERVRAGGCAVRGSFSAIVFPFSRETPGGDVAQDSSVRLSEIVVRRDPCGDGWFDATPPQIGDRITIAATDGEPAIECAVYDVLDFPAGGWSLKIKTIS